MLSGVEEEGVADIGLDRYRQQPFPMPVLLRNKKGDPLWAAFLFWIDTGLFFLADFLEVDVGNLFVSTA